MQNNTYALLVPCYNAGDYIPSFLKHLQSLERAFDEIIFYDDASTDNSKKLLQKSSYRVLSSAINKGPGFARNRLAEEAKSTFIHFHDIDDEFNPAFLNLVDDNLNSRDADVVLGNADWIDAVSRTKIIEWRYDRNSIKADPLIYFITHPLGIINTIYKKESFLKVKGFDEFLKCWEDADIHVRLAASGSVFLVIDKVLAYSLRHDKGISKNQLWCWSCRLAFLETYLEKYPDLKKNLFLPEIKKVLNAYIIHCDYRKLNQIIKIKSKYNLSINTSKISILYNLSFLLPPKLIHQMLNLAGNKRT